MDITAFGEFKTGQLVPIGRGAHEEWGFVPANLPPAWEVPASLWPLVSKANAKVGQLDGIGRTLPNPTLLLRPLQRREALKSSSLEGTFVDPQELLLFEVRRRKRRDAPQTDRESAWLEVFNHDLAIRTGQKQVQSGKAIDSSLIRTLHRMLLRHVRGKSRNPGEFRTEQVYVGDRRFIPPPPERVDSLLESFTDYLGNSEVDPLIRAYIAHYQFEAIHPFSDGNGRVGRVLLSLSIYKWLGHSAPWLYMSEFFENHRKEYITRLFEISASGEWENWLRFCLNGTIEQAASSVSRCDRLQKLRKQYKDRVGSLGPRMSGIIDRLFSRPITNARDIMEKFGVTDPTARADLEKLCNHDVLTLVPNAYPKSFFASEIMDIAYGA
jgi:Fic family protein